MLGIALLPLVLLLFGTTATTARAQNPPVVFVFIPAGGGGVVGEYELDGYTGGINTNATGTEYSSAGDRWAITWKVHGNGDITITCGVYGKKATFTDAANQCSGPGTRKHDGNSTDGTWTNVDWTEPEQPLIGLSRSDSIVPQQGRLKTAANELLFSRVTQTTSRP